MKTAAAILLAASLAGCTSITYRAQNGAEFHYFSSKNNKMDKLTFDPAMGKIEVSGLESDASSVIRAQAAGVASGIEAGGKVLATAALLP